MTNLLVVGLEPQWMIEPWCRCFALEFLFKQLSDHLDATHAAAVGALQCWLLSLEAPGGRSIVVPQDDPVPPKSFS